MNYRSVKNPQWADEDHTMINCTVDFEKLGSVPFSASPNDSEEHGREIFAKAASGAFGPIKEYSA